MNDAQSSKKRAVKSPRFRLRVRPPYTQYFINRGFWGGRPPTQLEIFRHRIHVPFAPGMHT